MDLEEAVKERLGESYEREVQKVIEEYHNLIPPATAVKILAKRLGIIKEKPRKIKDIKKGSSRVWVRAYIKEITATREINGKKMRKLILKDETGEIPLKLWNDQLKLLKDLSIGDLVEVKDAYEKNGLNLSFSGEIKVLERKSLTPLPFLKEGAVNVKGIVEEIEGKKPTSRGEFFIFYISDGETKVKCIIVEGRDRGERLSRGKEIILQNAYYKNGALWINRRTRMLVKKEIKKGKIKDMYVEGGKLVVVLEEGKLELPREEALKFLDARVAEDISLETVLNLKKEKFLGKEVILP